MPKAAFAHASQQGFVLLLPTGFYTAAGVLAVALTVFVLIAVPARWLAMAFAPVTVPFPRFRFLHITASCIMAVLLWLLIWAGLAGPRDPLANPLPLMIWTVFWVGFLPLQALIGNLWAFLNPWSGPLILARCWIAPRARLHLTRHTGHMIGAASFVAFALLLLAHPSPSDPAFLARLAAFYWLTTFVFALIFGPRWLRRAEGLTLALRIYARLGCVRRQGGHLQFGLPGWQLANGKSWSLIPAILAVILLGTGSFDGLNETFWWLGQLGINPFEFPGRSAIVWPSINGMLLANAALLAVFAVTLWLGLGVAKAPFGPLTGLRLFAPSILPIALGYHIAHYLPSFLVDSQYALVTLSDPLLNGSDLLNLGDFYVTTGFFNSQAPVRLIFLSQVSAVVVGHMLAVVLAHRIAQIHLPTPRQVILSQLPLSIFMVAYTFFGLWLLASPRF